MQLFGLTYFEIACGPLMTKALQKASVEARGMDTASKAQESTRGRIIGMEAYEDEEVCVLARKYILMCYFFSGFV